ncbi:hypothetical protein K504DRAFT_506440 [Pleomassaria siparia CBS 279.74]|uniref:Uncharacterized protein n=1 Tax=Pleomassaria siparia CBS 279.74 TaxID=1314801 RepID=A0A6G1JXR9_9PLEO|nr:hypothetical protein K504DRAFT_506440 [Pleomassaria siparia CBS 279.74]
MKSRLSRKKDDNSNEEILVPELIADRPKYFAVDWDSRYVSIQPSPLLIFIDSLQWNLQLPVPKVQSRARTLLKTQIPGVYFTGEPSRKWHSIICRVENREAHSVNTQRSLVPSPSTHTNLGAQKIKTVHGFLTFHYEIIRETVTRIDFYSSLREHL